MRTYKSLKLTFLEKENTSQLHWQPHPCCVLSSYVTLPEIALMSSLIIFGWNLRLLMTQ